jgi:hypothetical protein
MARPDFRRAVHGFRRDAEPWVYSNGFMVRLPPVLNVVLIDVAS